MTVRHFLEVTDLSADDLRVVLDLAVIAPESLGRPLAGAGAALIFEKPSTRTRHSTEMAVVQLGGHPVYTRADEVGFDVRETVEDVTRILQGYHRVITARVFEHAVLERMVAVADVPIVNLLSDQAHPLQAVADALTMEEAIGAPLAGHTVAWIGDYNNVARSLGEITVLMGGHIRYGCPVGYDATDDELERLSLLGAGSAMQTHRATEAVASAEFVHADTWVSMGQEVDKDERRRAFEGFRVDEQLMAAAAPQARFMHCMPAYRDIEVAADVFDGPRSIAVRQGHQRLPAARAVLAFLAGVRPEREEAPA